MIRLKNFLDNKLDSKLQLAIKSLPQKPSIERRLGPLGPFGVNVLTMEKQVAEAVWKTS